LENKESILNDIVSAKKLNPSRLHYALKRAEELIIHELIVNGSNEFEQATETLNEVVHPIYLFRKGLEQRLEQD
jgi:hypothetical protein